MKVNKTISLSVESAQKLSNQPNASKLIEALLKNHWDAQEDKEIDGILEAK